MTIPFKNLAGSVQFPFAQHADLVLVDLEFWWSDGGGGSQGYITSRFAAQHWCKQELKELEKMIKPKYDKFDYTYASSLLEAYDLNNDRFKAT